MFDFMQNEIDKPTKVAWLGWIAAGGSAIYHSISNGAPLFEILITLSRNPFNGLIRLTSIPTPSWSIS